MTLQSIRTPPRLLLALVALLGTAGLGAALDRHSAGASRGVGPFPWIAGEATEPLACRVDGDCAFLGGLDRGGGRCVDSSCVFVGNPPGRTLGPFRLTFYWLVREDDYLREPQRRWVDLYAIGGRHLGRYPRRFVREITMEGSGFALSGSILNWSGRCRYGTGHCFDWLDAGMFPYGRGSDVFRLTPFRAVAVDPKIIPFGTPLYLPEVDGVPLPDGTIHDGCVVAVDTGGGIRANHLDFFAPSRTEGIAFARRMGDRGRVHPEEDAPRCGYAARFVQIPLPGDVVP